MNVLKSLIRTKCLFRSSPINNKSTCLLKVYLIHRLDMKFLFVFITKSTNVNTILFFNFVNISNFDEKFDILKVYFAPKHFANLSNSFWIMICRMKVSQETLFKVIIIINILNINQNFSWVI